MIRAITHKLKSHYSLGIMAFGSFSVFFANLLFKESLNLEHYYNYSILIVFIALMNSFGLFGLEQVFVRITTIKNGVLEVSKKNIQAISLFTILNAALFSWILKTNYQFSEHFLILTLMSFAVIWLLFFYNLFRLNSQFVIAQIASNSWKVFLGIAVIISSAFKLNPTFHQLFIGLLIVLLACSIYCYLLAKNIRIVYKDLMSVKEISKLSFQFFISLLTLSFIAQSDKLIVDKIFGAEEFVNYFFLANLFLFPFSFIQSYIGFKEIVVMKGEKPYPLWANTLKVFLFAIVFAIVLVVMVSLLIDLGLLKISFAKNQSIILLFLSTGILRLVYAIYSAYFSCFASVQILRKANLVSIVVISIIVATVFKYTDSTADLAFFLCAIWASRLIIWAYFAHNIRKYIPLNKF